ncbi:MAG: ParB/Srx family N-terminal domain-containing protein [Anaerolineaceae bacterium]|nr:ParB/Srx family N-terminal domain-containing protein [Anaerolineaceae bacterium]
MQTRNPITNDVTRKIIEDFAQEIKEKKEPGPKPSKTVVFFRNERENNIERDVYELPINLLRFRKDNGRIASDVISYEKDKGVLLEEEESTQKLLRKFLEDKDPEKTKELVQSLRQHGQLDPAIITADGFLINGNRRKAALHILYEKEKNPKWNRMKVVILPGKGDPGGPPTLREIEQIENRYQLHSEGKSEYTLFDRALTIRRKIKIGIPLEEQLKDDPKFSALENREFTQAARKFKQEYLDPLEKIDTYLFYLGRENLYSTISTGPGDREGRWQAFLDYSKIYRNISDSKYRQKNNILILENEIGSFEEIVFKLIRKRHFPRLNKVHKIIRDLPRYLKNSEAKEELFKLSEIDLVLPDSESFDVDGNEYDERTKDSLWGEKHQTTIIRHVKKARDLIEWEKEKETPIRLLEDALSKLDDENLIPELVPKSEMKNALRLSESIEKRAKELRCEFYNLQKNKA